MNMLKQAKHFNLQFTSFKGINETLLMVICTGKGEGGGGRGHALQYNIKYKTKQYNFILLHKPQTTKAGFQVERR